MSRYAIWDKQSDIFTLGRDAETGKMCWKAQDYIDSHAPWADNPNVKVIVGGGAVNGTVFMEFDMAVEQYQRQGLELEDGMTDREILDAIEAFEDTPPPPPEPTAEERIAAALEFQSMLSMMNAGVK